MSIRLISRVWDSVPLEGTELLLLLAIAEHANDEGFCWPRLERLAQRVRRSLRQTRRLMRALEAGGFIATTRGCGRGNVALIRLKLIDAPTTLDEVMPDPFSETKADALVPLSAANEDADDPFSERTADAHVPLSAAKEVADDPFSERKAVTDVPLSVANEDADVPFSEVKAVTDVRHSETEKRTPSAQEGSSSAQKGTPSAQKADIRSHAHGEPSKNHQLNRQEKRKGSLAPPTGAEGGKRAKTPSQVAGKDGEEQTAIETAQQRYFGIVCWIVGWDHRTLTRQQQGQVAQTVGVLQRAGYSEPDLRTFWTEVWQNDWRWQRSRSRPSLSQVRAEIGKLRTESTALAPAAGTAATASQKIERELSAEELEIREKMREAKERARLRKANAPNEGLRLPELQGHEVGLPGRAGEAPRLRESLQVPVPTGN